MLNMPTKVDVTEEINEVQKDLDTYKKYVGKNFMSATEQTAVMDQAIE